MRKDFTNNSVIKARPKAAPYELRDGKVRGLILRVQPSGKKSWIAEVRNYKGKKRRLTLADASIKTLEWARKRAQQVLAEPAKYFHEKRAEKAGKSNLLGDFLNGPYAEYASTHFSDGTRVLSSLKSNFGHLYSRPMDQISETDIERWKRSKSVKHETLVRIYGSLKAALNRAVREFHIIPSHPLERYSLKRPRNDPHIGEFKDPRYLTEDEEDRLRNALSHRDEHLRKKRISGNRWRRDRGYPLKPDITGCADYLTPMVLVALNTGLRRGDLFNLEWQHVNFNLRHIRKVINKISHTKFGMTPKTIPLSDEALMILQQWRRQNPDSDLVFPNPQTGRRLDNINKAWSGLLEDAKISNFRFHDLRHTFASRLVMEGIDLNTVRELMCHSDIKMTLVYAHLSPGHKESAIDKAFNKRIETPKGIQ